MPEYVRVTDEVRPRREYSVVASAVDPEVHEVLDKPGAYPDGQPIPPKYTPDDLAASGDSASVPESLSSSTPTSDPKPAPADKVAPSGRQAKLEKEADS